MIEPVNFHIQFFVPILLFQHRCFMEALFHTLTFDLGFAGYFRFREVGSSSVLFLKSGVQKVEYFFMLNEEVNVEDRVYEHRATVQELKKCFGDVFLHFGIQKECRSFFNTFYYHYILLLHQS
ncbi:hypothetical protein HanRHA438_Chr09g0400181 [Helianthus annuus]|nr:hypothetical protein HanRHA438_Chr09g0400181 [Helianthus annuus]